ncbi:MAG: DUF420 domain-containing protein [Phycisphaerales bacterium]|nr:DUF420 domain-containing protein [Phycisphaerales bacterium]
MKTIQKNDSLAYWLIGLFSFIVFAVVVSLGRFHVTTVLPFNVHIFAFISALINSITAILLVVALVAIKQNKITVHKNVMLTALLLSVFFLLFYIAHHLFAGETKYAGSASTRMVYLIILASHIFLASVILPFILYTAYRGLTGEYPAHKKIAKITWPIWFYVTVTGPIIYWMISPYYH